MREAKKSISNQSSSMGPITFGPRSLAPALTFWDHQRQSSMAEEGGASAAFWECEEKEVEEAEETGVLLGHSLRRYFGFKGFFLPHFSS